MLFLLINAPIFILISGFRGINIGTDTQNYLHGYNLIKHSEWKNINDIVDWEIGYTYLNKLIAEMTNSDQVLLLITSLLVTVGIFHFIYKNSPNVYFSVYLYFTLYYYFISFNAIRQFIAISILVYGYQFVKERKMIRFLLFVGLAASFHLPALIFAPIYFLYNINLDFKKFIIITTSFALMLIGFEYIFNFFLSIFPEYSIYVDSKFFQGSGLLTTTISGSILFFGIFIKLLYRTNKEYSFLLLIAVFSFFVSILSIEMTIFNRLGFYFSIFNIIFIPYALSFIKGGYFRTFSYILIGTITLCYLIARLLEDWQRIIPYNFFI